MSGLKSFEISKHMVYEAYLKVKANKGAAGVDGQSVGSSSRISKGTCTSCGTGCRRVAIFRRRCGWWRSPSREARGPGFSACRRRRHSAVEPNDRLGFVVVTHPFHPLSGQRLEVLFAKRRDEGVVFVCGGGVYGSITLPQAWTDRGEPPLAHRLSAEGLAALDTLARAMGGR